VNLDSFSPAIKFLLKTLGGCQKKVDKLKEDYIFIDKKSKNKKNNLGEDYFKDHILGESLMHFEKIESFLDNPINEKLKDYYFDTANELGQIINN